MWITSKHVSKKVIGIKKNTYKWKGCLEKPFSLEVPNQE